MFKIKSILGLLVFCFVFSVAFNLAQSENAFAQCTNQSVIIDAEEGTCLVQNPVEGIVSDTEDSNANCSIAGRFGERINCTCHTPSILPRNDSLFMAEGFACCIDGLFEGAAIVTNDTRGVESQGSIFNVTCKAMLD